jgi:23S rRNA pseudouridine1911/1915/1917 synthase
VQERTVQREYQAIAMGVMTAGGTVDAAMGRHPIERKRMAVTSTGKTAITHYRVAHRYRSHTHIRCKLETGRTHQIRVHLSHAGHSLVGDPMYGGRVRFPKKASEELKDALLNFKRQALHSKKLTLTHPISGESMSWKAPLPDDMLQLLEVLKNFDS